MIDAAADVSFICDVVENEECENNNTHEVCVPVPVLIIIIIMMNNEKKIITIDSNTQHQHR